MVGERYRDLIEAADTIQNMRLCSGSVIKSVGGMQQSCNSLQHQSVYMQSVTGWQARDFPHSAPNNPYLGVAAAIKLLTATPELIWAAVEDGKAALGAQLFLLAQHVHTGLQADAGGQVTGDKIAQWFPVIARQWATIQQLQTTLLTQCESVLSSEDISPSACVDSLAAMILLKNCSVEKIFQVFLSLRSSSVSSVLQAGRTHSARTAMSSTASCIIASVQATYQAFIQEGLIGSLTTILSSTAPPTIEKVGCSTLGPIAKYLPTPILQFRPRLREKLTGLDREHVIGGMVKWFDDVAASASVEAKSLLEYVTTVEGLVGLREGLYQALSECKGVAWNNVMVGTLGMEICIWNTLYNQQLTNRVVELLGHRIREVVGKVKIEVPTVLSNSEQQLQDEIFVWTEASSDLSNSNSWGKGQPDKGGLEMKCWGWNPSIQALCGDLDIGLKGVLENIEAYTKEVVEEEGPFDKYSDSEEIILKCSNICKAEIEDMVISIRNQHIKDKETTNFAFLLARFYQALLPMTTSLVLCLKGNIMGIGCSNHDEVTPLVGKESEEMLNLWIKKEISIFKSSLLSIGSDCILSNLPAWDKVTISETGDSGEEVTSIISIPPSPSLSLITSLLSLASRIHSAHPSSFPPTILPPTCVRVVESAVDQYLALAELTLTQNLALQLLFDIHFIQTLLVSREYKEQFSETISNIISSLERNIDPFDLSVFSPHLHTRVKKAAARSVSGVGCLVPGDRVAIISTYKAPTTTSQDSHNILCVEPQPCTRFQLLPIAPAGVKAGSRTGLATANLQLPLLVGGQGVIDAKKTTARRDKSPVHQTAASFFGSMPWFGATS